MHVQRFVLRLILYLLLSLAHIVLMVFILRPNQIVTVFGFILALLNMMILIHYFIQSIKLYQASKAYAKTKHKPIFLIQLFLGVFVNGGLLYLLFILTFSHFSAIVQIFTS